MALENQEPSTAPANNKGTVVSLIRVLLAIVLPPLSVLWQKGLGGTFWLNIVLTLLGYIPGVIHAIWIIMRR